MEKLVSVLKVQRKSNQTTAECSRNPFVYSVTIPVAPAACGDRWGLVPSGVWERAFAHTRRLTAFGSPMRQDEPTRGYPLASSSHSFL